jgi:hypothetical protein
MIAFCIAVAVAAEFLDVKMAGVLEEIPDGRIITVRDEVTSDPLASAWVTSAPCYDTSHHCRWTDVKL